jgi:hypothetical protein
MLERSHTKLGFVLIIVIIAAVAGTTHCPKTATKRQGVKTAKRIAVLPPVKKPLQRIGIVSPNCCWVSNLKYRDDRAEKKTSYWKVDDVWKETEDGGPNISKSTSICRNYLGDAKIEFRLNGPSCRNGLHFDILNDNRPRIDKFYPFDIKFDEKGFADIEIQMKKNKITNIFQEKPQLKTLY